MTITKFVFIDLDETLIYAQFCGRTDPRSVKLTNSYSGIKETAAILRVPSSIDNKNTLEYYSSELRPGAIQLLSALRKKYTVLMLTAATIDYAEANNEAHGLGFSEAQIYGREHTESAPLLSSEQFKNGKAYLIDNLPRADNTRKMGYLKLLNPVYLQIDDYYGRIDEAITAEQISTFLKDIAD